MRRLRAVFVAVIAIDLLTVVATGPHPSSFLRLPFTINSSDLQGIFLSRFPSEPPSSGVRSRLPIPPTPIRCRQSQCPSFSTCQPWKSQSTEPLALKESFQWLPFKGGILSNNWRINSSPEGTDAAAQSLETLSACDLPEFSDDEEHAAPEIFGCPRLLPRQGGQERVNETCMMEGDARGSRKSALQLFLLRGAFLSGSGALFDSRRQFWPMGCPGLRKFAFKRGHPVSPLTGPVVFWLAPHPANFFHFVADALPALLVALRALNGSRAHVLARGGQWKLYKRVAAPLLGLPLASLKPVTILKPALYHAQEVYQPSFQLCHNPNKALWSFLRLHHFLHPSGLPLFHRDGTIRSTQPITAQEAASYPSDWVVVLGRRKGSRQLMQAGSILRLLLRLFGAARVKQWSGRRPILKARALFRRTRLYVGAHGAGLTHLIFMPFHSFVLEIRPKHLPTACFHHLALACSLRFFLALAEGDRHSPLNVSLPGLRQQLEHIRGLMNASRIAK